MDRPNRLHARPEPLDAHPLPLGARPLSLDAHPEPSRDREGAGEREYFTGCEITPEARHAAS